MPRYRRVAAVSTTSVRDLRSVKEPAAPEPVGEKAEKMTVGDMTVEPVDEVSATAGEQTEEPQPDPPKRKRGRPRKNPEA